MAKAFISYRRTDSATFTGRIYDRLIAKFGRKNVFKDVDDIPPGVNFAQYIPDSLRQCAVELVVIGPQWLETRDTQGNRRLDDPADFVRLEIETALNLGLVVIPLLVDDATMPASADLPESINQLSLINALQVRNDPDFARDMERVITGVERGFARKGVTSAPERRTRRTALPTIKLPVRLRRPLIIVLTLLLIFASFTALVETGGVQALFLSRKPTATLHATATPQYSAAAPGPGCDHGAAPWEKRYPDQPDSSITCLSNPAGTRLVGFHCSGCADYRTGFFLRTTTSFELPGGFAISVQVSDLSLDGLFELYLAFQGDTQLDTYGILLHGDGMYSVGHGTGSGFPGPPLGQGTVVTSAPVILTLSARNGVVSAQVDGVAAGSRDDPTLPTAQSTTIELNLNGSAATTQADVANFVIQ